MEVPHANEEGKETISAGACGAGIHSWPVTSPPWPPPPLRVPAVMLALRVAEEPVVAADRQTLLEGGTASGRRKREPCRLTVWRVRCSRESMRPLNFGFR